MWKGIRHIQSLRALPTEFTTRWTPSGGWMLDTV